MTWELSVLMVVGSGSSERFRTWRKCHRKEQSINTYNVSLEGETTIVLLAGVARSRAAGRS